MNARCDVLIIGGGVAGLWARAALARAGYSVVLVERTALGDGQTLASQGILHAGLKYRLAGETAGDLDDLASEHARWIDRLAGKAWPDLSSVEQPCPGLTMWTPPGALSGLRARLVTHGLRSACRLLPPAQRPAAFDAAPRRLGVWQVNEPVIDPRSLLRELAAAAGPRAPMLRLDARGAAFTDTPGGVEAALLTNDAPPVRIHARCVLLAAGNGNRALLTDAGLDWRQWMQVRPLEMVAMSHAPAPLYGHCVSLPWDLCLARLRPGRSIPDPKPRLTITTARTSSGLHWYIGGHVAEPFDPRTGAAGPEESEPEARIRLARQELSRCLGWLDFSRAAFSVFPIDRAEGRTPHGTRPHGPVISQPRERILALWPTKLALAPLAAERVLGQVRTICPSPAEPTLDGLGRLPAPRPGDLPWIDQSTPWN